MSTPIFEATMTDHGLTIPLGVVERADQMRPAMDTCRGCKQWTPVHDIDADGLCWGCGS